MRSTGPALNSMHIDAGTAEDEEADDEDEEQEEGESRSKREKRGCPLKASTSWDRFQAGWQHDPRWKVGCFPIISLFSLSNNCSPPNASWASAVAPASVHKGW